MANSAFRRNLVSSSVAAFSAAVSPMRSRSNFLRNSSTFLFSIAFFFNNVLNSNALALFNLSSILTC